MNNNILNIDGTDINLSKVIMVSPLTAHFKSYVYHITFVGGSTIMIFCENMSRNKFVEEWKRSMK